MKFTLRLFIAFFCCLSTIQVSASHLMGGDITYQCIGNNTYAFTAQLYRDCNGIMLPNTIQLSMTSANCGQTLSFTLELVPSSPQIVTPICPTEPDACNVSGSFFGVHSYTYTHVPSSQGMGVVLPASCNDWVISYSTCCRNGTIGTGPANDGFYIETTIDNTNNLCNNSPSFLHIPILYACLGDTVTYGHGVTDIDNDSLVFSLTPCLTGATANATVSYNTPYSGTNPLSVTYSSFDPSTGSWRFVPNLAQVGVVCMLVEEYRNGNKIGEVMRDIQITVLNCTNQSPILSGINGTATSTGSTGSNTISTCAGQNICFTIDAYDANNAQNIGLNYTNSLPGATYLVNTTGNTAQVSICWTPTLNDIGTNHFGLSVFDDACPVIGKGNYGYKIIVTGAGGGATFNQTTINQGNFAQLQINLLDSNCTINWASSASLSCTNCLNPIAIPTATTTYYYQINCPSASCGWITDSVTVTVLTPRVLTGIVTTSDGSPLDSSWVYAHDAQGGIITSSLTDAMGSYSLSVLDSTLFVSITPGSLYFDQAITYYNATTDFAMATPYAFSNGSTSGTLNFSTIALPKTVSGIITKSDGTPLEISYVYLLDDNFDVLDTTLTTLSGQYSFSTYESSVHLLAIPNSINLLEMPTFYDGVSDTSLATLITFTSPQTTASFSTLPAPPSIIGTITRADGLPLDNSWMFLIDSSMTNIDSMVTTVQGYYGFVVPDVTINYYVKAIPGSNHGDQVITYYNGSETIQAANPISITTILNIADYSTIDTFSLTGGKGIGGTVSLGTDTPTPLADVRMILQDINGNFINDATTDDDGKFKFYSLDNGTYKVLVDKTGIDNNLAPVIELRDGETSPENLEFLLHSYYLEMFYPTSTIEIIDAQNISIYPNPIQTTFTIEYDLKASANIAIDILDVNGKIVSTIINENQTAGNHLLNVNTEKELTKGVYFVRIVIDGQSIIQKIIKQ